MFSYMRSIYTNVVGSCVRWPPKPIGASLRPNIEGTRTRPNKPTTKYYEEKLIKRRMSRSNYLTHSHNKFPAGPALGPSTGAVPAALDAAGNNHGQGPPPAPQLFPAERRRHWADGVVGGAAGSGGVWRGVVAVCGGVRRGAVDRDGEEVEVEVERRVKKTRYGLGISGLGRKGLEGSRSSGALLAFRRRLPCAPRVALGPTDS
jgi:hypothetical protein